MAEKELKHICLNCRHFEGEFGLPGTPLYGHCSANVMISLKGQEIPVHKGKVASNPCDEFDRLGSELFEAIPED